ncbi:hypothetical protein D3C78_1524030 [compost metagenome]
MSIDGLFPQPLHVSITHYLGQRSFVDQFSRYFLVVTPERCARDEDLLGLGKMGQGLLPAARRRMVTLINDDEVEEVGRHSLRQ